MNHLCTFFSILTNTDLGRSLLTSTQIEYRRITSAKVIFCVFKALSGFSPEIRSRSIILNSKVRTANSSKLPVLLLPPEEESGPLESTFFTFQLAHLHWSLRGVNLQHPLPPALLSLAAFSSFPELSKLTATNKQKHFSENMFKTMSKALQSWWLHWLANYWGMFYLLNVIILQLPWRDQSKLGCTTSFGLTER